MTDRGRTGFWVVLVVGAVFICVTMGTRQSFGLYLPAYMPELDISRGAFALAIAMQNIMWGLGSPLFGAWADRRGPVPAALAGAVLHTVGLWLMASSPGTGELILAQMLVGMGIAGAGFSVILGTVGKVAPERHRSVALGVVTAAGSVGQFAIVPMVHGAIEGWGNQESVYMLVGMSVLLLALAPLLRIPRGHLAGPSQGAGMAVLRTAWGSTSYVLLFCGFFVCGFQVVFVAVHLPAYLADAGLPPGAAATALALVGLCNIFGSLLCGWLGDRYPKKTVLAWFYALRSLVIVIFLLVPLSPLSVAVFGAAIGFLWLGTVPLTAGLVGVFFGARHMSMLYGVIFVSHQLGSFSGSWLGGLLYEWTGSYDVVWYLAVALGLVAAALHMPIRERPDECFRLATTTAA